MIYMLILVEIHNGRYSIIHKHDILSLHALNMSNFKLYIKLFCFCFSGWAFWQKKPDFTKSCCKLVEFRGKHRCSFHGRRVLFIYLFIYCNIRGPRYVEANNHLDLYLSKSCSSLHPVPQMITLTILDFASSKFTVIVLFSFIVCKAVLSGPVD